MLRSMPVRRFKRGFKLGLIKLLIGDKAAGVHLSYVGRGASADLCRRIVDIGHTDILVVTDKALKELGLSPEQATELTGERPRRFSLALPGEPHTHPRLTWRVLSCNLNKQGAPR